MGLLVSRRLYRVSADFRCHCCDELTPVMALAAHEIKHDGEPYGESTVGGGLLLLCDLSDMPDAVCRLLQQRNPRYARQRESDDAMGLYFGNHCHCGEEIHDIWLMSGARAVFAPVDARAAATITIERLPVVGHLRFEGGCFHGDGDLIWRYGRAVRQGAMTETSALNSRQAH